MDISHYVDLVYQAARTNIFDIRNGEINAGNVILLATQLMVMVEDYPELTGGQKKHVVLEVLRRTVDDSTMDPNDKFAVKAVINTVVPPAIDQIIRASRGDLDLNKVRSCFSSLWKKIKDNCCCCCK